MTVCHPLDAPSGSCLANAAEHAARTALTPQQRFERLKRQITSAFSLPLTFYDIDVESLDESHFGVRHQHVDSTFAAYMHSTGYCARMDRGSMRSAAVSLIFVLDGTMSLMQNSNANTMRPGEAYLFHAARPAHFSFKTPFQEVIVGIPYEALSRFVPNPDGGSIPRHGGPIRTSIPLQCRKSTRRWENCMQRNAGSTQMFYPCWRSSSRFWFSDHHCEDSALFKARHRH